LERDYGSEIDSLKNELNEIKQLLNAFAGSKTNEAWKQAANYQQKHAADGEEKQAKRIHKMENMHPDTNIMGILNNLENACEQSGQSGSITYLGVFESGGRQSTWIRNQVNTDGLLYLVENKSAEKVLRCIGNSDRLHILMSILKKPMTVAQLVEECGYNSTGQVYHHLKPLIAADLVIEDAKKGVYVIQHHRVQGIIMLLAGISDMLDPQYTAGDWDMTE
jgi:DNA gyrase subunit B